MDHVKINGVFLDPNNDMVVRASENGMFEPQTFNYLDRIIGTLVEVGFEVNFFDIGAYTGIYSIFANKMCKHVVGFEPNPLVYSRCIENVKYNEHVKKPVINNCALSDKKGLAEFRLRPSTILTSAGQIVGKEFKGNTIKVTCITLDKYAEISGIYPDVMKIDVEGHELNVLKGAINVLTTASPILIIELLNDDKKKQVEDFLFEYSYMYDTVLDERNYVYVKEYSNAK